MLGKPKHPLIAIVSGTGRIDLTRVVFHTTGITALVLTTETGRLQLTEAGAGTLSSTVIHVVPASEGRLTPSAILSLLRGEFGARLVLHEGGPTLFGQFLAEKVIDELCLTLALQTAGQEEARPRPALVMNREFVPSTAPWRDLLSAKRGGNHLYLRYRMPAKTAR